MIESQPSPLPGVTLEGTHAAGAVQGSTSVAYRGPSWSLGPVITFPLEDGVSGTLGESEGNGTKTGPMLKCSHGEF